ncbi:MAG: Hsp20 family protein [Methanoregulaceae archaeon]|nr:Hsp20 family protein [Methanoregulaceae archaeon]
MDYLHRERHYTWFARDISSPEEVDPDKADGSMNTGILEPTVPEKEPRPGKRPGKIEITFFPDPGGVPPGLFLVFLIMKYVQSDPYMNGRARYGGMR